MRTILKAITAASLLAATATPALAQATGGILTLDLDRVLTESAAGKSAQAQLQARFQAPNQQAQAAVNAAQSAYVSQIQAAQKLVPSGDASKLPPATRASLGAAQDKLEEARGQYGQLQQAIQASIGYVREQITAQVLPIAEQVRAEKKAAVVLLRGSMLAADPAADVTSAVLPRLDAKLTTVPIAPPQQTAPAPAAATPKPGTQGR